MTQSSTPLLEVSHLTKTFPGRGGLISSRQRVHAVSDVSFTIGHGETLGLVGESGCGKSTLGRTILRLTPKDEGTVKLTGEDIGNIPERQFRSYRRRMQLIFQDPYACLNPKMSVLELIRAPLAAYHQGTRDEQEDQVIAMLERVGLNKHQLYRYPHEFSGGQRQRIGIARALILEPELVVCDEPVSALDVSVRAQVLNLMRALQREMGLGYLFISHDLSVVRCISNRIAVMYLGRIVELADRRTLFENPLHPYTKALMGAIPRPDPIHATKLRELEGDLPSPYNPPPGCAFHTRCENCHEECRRLLPHLREVEPGHFVSCLQYNDMDN